MDPNIPNPLVQNEIPISHPNPQQLTDKIPKSTNRRILILFIVILLIGAVWGLIYYLKVRQDKSKNEAVTALDWKTCTNTDYGFSISYPASFSKGVSPVTCDYHSGDAQYAVYPYDNPTIADFRNNWNISISINKTASDINKWIETSALDGWARTKPISGPIKDSLQYDSYTVSGSDDAKLINNSKQYSQAINNNYGETNTVIEINNTIFDFSLGNSRTFPSQDIRKFYNQILSHITFQKKLVIQLRPGIDSKSPFGLGHDADYYLSESDMANLKVYHSSYFGFSIEVPARVVGENTCIDPGQTEKNFLTPVIEVEDQERNKVYIAKEYNYDSTTAWHPDKGTVQTGLCEKQTESLDSLRKYNVVKEIMPTFFNPVGAGWAIYIAKNIKNDDDLNKFLKDNNGSDCAVKGKLPWKYQDGAYDILVGTENPNKSPRESNCNLYFGMLYSPTKEEVMALPIKAEAPNDFYDSYDGSHGYDTEMIKSFRFE